MMSENKPSNNTDAKGQQHNRLLIVAEVGALALIVAFLIFGSRLEIGQNRVESETLPPTVEGASPQLGMGAVQVGQIAPDFALETVSGEQVALSELRGRPVIINFWATWCAPCRYEMPELQETVEAYAGDDLALLAVNREESHAEIIAFFDELSADEGIAFTFPSLLDHKSEVGDLYGVFNMPTTFFIDAEGVVTAVHFGPLVRSQIDDYMADLLVASTN